MEKTTLYLPASIQRRLQHAAKRRGTSQAAIVREALTHYLADEPSPVSSFIGAFPGKEPPDGRDWGEIKRDLRERRAAELEERWARARPTAPEDRG